MRRIRISITKIHKSKLDYRSKQSYVSGTGSTKKTGYSAGSGLRSIAQGSADQAKSAVSNQHAAGKQAAYVAQVNL